MRIRDRRQERCLIFLHIPKTAGLTLSSVMRGYYQQSRIIRFNSLDCPISNLEEITLSERREADVLMGHMHYGVHRYIPRESEYVTLLRDPVDRVISLYRYIFKDPRHPLHRSMTSAKTSLESFIEERIDPTQAENGQTRLLSGRQDVDPGLEELALARTHLKRFSFVGLTEHFDESLLLMAQRFGWRLPVYVSRNVFAMDPRVPMEAASNLDISKRAIEMIRESNSLDLELYEVADGLFHEHVDGAGQRFARRVRRFRRINRVPDLVGIRAWRVVRKFRDRRVLSNETDDEIEAP